MTEVVIVLPDLAATEAAGNAIGRMLQVGDVVMLSGPLGAGKTTLARAVIEALGWAGEVASPTFPIVITYDAPDVRVAVAHVDLYRIEDRDQLEELGLDELRETAVLIVEWPEHGEPFDDALAVTLAVDADGARRLTARASPRWEGRWPSPRPPQ